MTSDGERTSVEANIKSPHLYLGKNVTIIPDDICSVIKTMKLGKACGSIIV